ncbi:FAD binding domain-containing protein [Streptomyces sp. P1-3]|uniref:FAD binding domain-containing protein n=1 Tax=Streptomyces sp. P1-3 TaxID=3421658 RepID=UPI003D36CDD5
MTTHAPQAGHTVTLPGSLDEAVAALTAMPAAVPVAGGTDLMAAVNSGLLRPAGLVGLGRISEIRGWQYQDGHALLGAGLTHARMGRPDFAALIPALAAAARAAGPPQIRNAGTLGGNIVSAAPTGDALPVLAALDAVLVVFGPKGPTKGGTDAAAGAGAGSGSAAGSGVAGASAATREIPVGHLLAGVEMLRPGEIVGFVRVPLLHAPQSFLKATGRTGPGRATASVAVVLDPARRHVRCAVGAVAPMPLRPLDAEAWVASLIDWDGDRGLDPQVCTAFGEYVAAACIPDPAPPQDGGEPVTLPPAALHLRRTVAALARRALGRALA